MSVGVRRKKRKRKRKRKGRDRKVGGGSRFPKIFLSIFVEETFTSPAVGFCHSAHKLPQWGCVLTEHGEVVVSCFGDTPSSMDIVPPFTSPIISLSDCATASWYF